jgi:hypothetical protein
MKKNHYKNRHILLIKILSVVEVLGEWLDIGIVDNQQQFHIDPNKAHEQKRCSLVWVFLTLLQ